MKQLRSFFENGNVALYALTGSAIVGFLAIFSVLGLQSPYNPEGVAYMHIEPNENRVTVGETFTVEVFVDSYVPVNVFAGEVLFDHTVLKIDAIHYNTSIAELWAERPWYDNGAGTLNFAGGTTDKSGFVGSGSLIQITFEALSEGSNVLSIKDPRILLHNGLGTDASLRPSIDSLVTVESDVEKNLIVQSNTSKLTVVKERPSTDLNGDGKQSIADISIFMMHIAGNDARYDFNLDGEVNLKDLNILLSK